MNTVRIFGTRSVRAVTVTVSYLGLALSMMKKIVPIHGSQWRMSERRHNAV